MNMQSSESTASASNPIQEVQTTSQPASQNPNPRRYVVALLVGLLLAACAAAIVPYCFAPHYQATATLLIEEKTPFVAFQDNSERPTAKRYIQTQLELLQSPVILEPVLSRYEISQLPELHGVPDRVDHLQSQLAISRIGESELFRVSYTSPSPKDAAKVVNAIISEYMTSHASDESQRSQRVVDILEEERRRRGQEVERLRKRVIDLSMEVTGKNPFEQSGSDSNSTRLISLLDRLSDIEAEEELCKAELQFVADHPVTSEKNGKNLAKSDSQDSGQPVLQGWQAAIEESESFVSDIKKSDPKWSDNPNYVRIAKNAEKQRSELDRAKLQLGKQTTANDVNKIPEESVLELKRQLELFEIKKRILSQRIDDLTKNQKTSSRRVVDLEFARAELAREDKVFESIAARKIALQTELRAPARIQLRHSADIPGLPVVERHDSVQTIACLAAFFAPLVIAFAYRPSSKSDK